MSKDLQCIVIIVILCLFIVINVARSRPKKKPHVYDKTIYKPRKRENKGMPEGDFTHEHVESMWDEIK